MSEVDEKFVLARLKPIRNKSMQRLVYTYWKFGHRFYKKEEVMKFLMAEVGLNDLGNIRFYYSAFALITLIANRRCNENVLKAKQGKL